MTKSDVRSWLKMLDGTISTIRDRLGYIGNELDQTTEEDLDNMAEWLNEDDIVAARQSAADWTRELEAELGRFSAEAEE